MACFLILGFWGIFLSLGGGGVFLVFKNCKLNVNLLLGPVVKLGMGHNCGEKSKTVA